jgi:hypothetical protein
MGHLFDIYVAVDWSSRNSPSPFKATKDSIFIAWQGEDDRTKATYARTRMQVRDLLLEKLTDWKAAKKRVLVGFDFAFGYPEGFAEACFPEQEGRPWQRTWAGLADLIEDDDKNRNNRFEVAEILNEKCGNAGPGPFWGMHHQWKEKPLLRKTRPHTSPGGKQWSEQCSHLSTHRLTDQNTPGTQETWKIYGNGSVGSQSLTGIPVLQFFRFRSSLGKKISIWPFESGFTPPKLKRGEIVFAEIYPSEVVRGRQIPENEILDRYQVCAVVQRMAALDKEEQLGERFGPPSSIEKKNLQQCIDEEGWILPLY